jgi:hypothetical protein
MIVFSLKRYVIMGFRVSDWLRIDVWNCVILHKSNSTWNKKIGGTLIKSSITEQLWFNYDTIIPTNTKLIKNKPKKLKMKYIGKIDLHTRATPPKSI